MSATARFGFSYVPTKPQRLKRRCLISGKGRWLTRLDAQLIVARLSGTGGVYRCKCGYWHVTRRQRALLVGREATPK